jgi:hypothetical protein
LIEARILGDAVENRKKNNLLEARTMFQDFFAKSHCIITLIGHRANDSKLYRASPWHCPLCARARILGWILHVIQIFQYCSDFSMECCSHSAHCIHVRRVA